jgi:hypothetical protein
MTDPLPPTPLPMPGGPDAVNPGAALDKLMAMPAWASLRTWNEPFRSIAIRAVARRLAAGLEPEWALWGALLEATQDYCDALEQLPAPHFP